MQKRTVRYMKDVTEAAYLLDQRLYTVTVFRFQCEPILRPFLSVRQSPQLASPLPPRLLFCSNRSAVCLPAADW